MATTFVEYTGDGSATKQFTFPSYQSSDVKVRVDGVLKTAGNHYNITSYTTTGGGNVVFTSGNIPSSPALIRIYRDTSVDAAKATYTPGSSVKAADLNNNNTQLLYRAQEEQVPNLIQSYDIDAGAVETSNIKADAITGAKIADDQIDSEHYVDGSIDTAHIGDSQVTTAKIADANITHVKLANDCIDGDNIQDDVINSEHYAATSIDTEHIANENITTAKLANSAVTSAKIADANIITSKIADDAVTTDKLANSIVSDITANNAKVTNVTTNLTTSTGTGSVTINSSDGTNATIGEATSSAAGVMSTDHHDKLDGIEAGATGDQTNAEIRAAVEAASDSNVFTDADHSKLDGIEASATADQTASEIKTLLQSDKLTASEIATGALDGRYFTETELTNGALDGRYFTETEADARYFNVSTGDTIKDGDTFPDNDTTIATTAAINDRIIDIVNDVGGFDIIESEQHFPNTNPQGAAGSAAVLSVKAASTTLTPSGTTVTISNGNLANNANITITGVTAAIPSGFGFLVESTATLHTYTFHRLVPKATEVTTVASKAVEIGRLGTADAVADMNTLGTSAIVSDMDTLADISSNITTVANNSSNVTTVAGISGNVTTVAGISGNVTTVANNNSNVTAVAGNATNINAAVNNATNINTTASNISNVNSVGNNVTNVNSVSSIGGANQTFTITVQDVSGNKYFVDGVQTPVLKLARGKTYTFDMSDSSNATHPLAFRDSSDNSYTTGVTTSGTAGSSGATVVIVVAANAPSSLKYYCTSHGNAMGNTITVIDDNIGTVAGISSDVTTVAGISSNVTSVANNTSNINSAVSNASNINSAVSNASNINTVAGSISNVNTTAGSISNVNTVASNINSVNNFASQYRIGSSNPTTSLDVGDLFFNTTSDSLKVYTGSAWVDGVTATGNFAVVTGNTFTGSNNHNDNVKSIYGTGSDLEIYHDGTDSYIKNNTGNLYLNYGSDMGVKIEPNNKVQLFHNGAIKFETLSTGSKVYGNITVTGNVDGRDVAADGTKLDGIESGATADQTAAEIRTLVESASDSNVFTDADHSKLNGIEASATADQTASEIRALVESASDSNVFTDADHSKLNGIEASATADQTSTEIKSLLASDKLTSSHLAANSVTNTIIADEQVFTANLDNFCVTASKLASNAVTTAKIADDAVTAAKLADTSVTAGSYGSATAIPAITIDAQGRITAASTNAVNTTTNLGTSTATDSVTVTSSSGNNATINEATSSAAGVMSTAHHDKLDGIAAGATNVTNTNQLTNGAGFITSGAATAFPSGTKMLFQQTSAPTGWTKVTSGVNNKSLRVVSGTAGSGGTNAFTDTFTSSIGITANAANTTATGNISVANSTAGGNISVANTTAGGNVTIANAETGGTVNSHTLSTNEMPSHSHHLYVIKLTNNNSQYAAHRGIYSGNGAYANDFYGPKNAAYNQNGTDVSNTGGGGGHSHGFTGGSHNHNGTLSGTAHNHNATFSGSAHNHNATFSGSAHNHSISVNNLDMAVQYLDVIIAAKD